MEVPATLPEAHDHAADCPRCAAIAKRVQEFIDGLVAIGCTPSEVAQLMIRRAVDHAAEHKSLEGVIDEFNYTQHRYARAEPGTLLN